MRFLIINLLATALLFIGASTAGAIAVTSASPEAGETPLAVGDQVTVTVTLDTEGQDTLVLVSIGVIFDPAVLSYNLDTSVASSYVLYNSPGKGVLAPLKPAAGSFPNYTPEIRFGTTDQVNVDFTGDLTTGAAATGAAYALYAEVSPHGTANQLVTLVFDVIGEGATTVDLSITSAGNILQLAGGINTTGSLSPDLNFQVPEPGIASLSLAALLTLGALRHRNRRAQ